MFTYEKIYHRVVFFLLSFYFNRFPVFVCISAPHRSSVSRLCRFLLLRQIFPKTTRSIVVKYLDVCKTLTKIYLKSRTILRIVLLVILHWTCWNWHRCSCWNVERNNVGSIEKSLRVGVGISLDTNSMSVVITYST